ncbi:DegT/DnrJ/EryC1/StrS family aminotransferase [Butyrivibrio sp. VCB2001]|uniref:DegT/DnrJ/EryC1/StrS family aminotransferase n=1 Tax=Butyrivibrio sp. VCB2001 TaxID=1280667 RepID=UPI0004022BBE|nr:DegT/DnrJ/EryC1/StrS family aminotransferase [Butyrivibrio sp. VCB2001]
MNDNIYVTKPSLPPLDEYVEYLKEIWESKNLTNMGKFWQEFNRKLSEFLDVEYCMPLCNGHMALELTLQAFELSGEVITTPFTFASTTHAIVRNNLTPVFCDIRECDCTIDPDKIEELITDKTTAILPVHVYGMPCDMARIEEIARKNNLKVIYDSAHAFGEKIDGKSIAEFGDASMFSFHATKCFNSIEGGCIATNQKEIMYRVYQLHNFGILGKENVEYVGANAKMNELQAAMGLCNLGHYEEERNKREVLFNRYIQRIKEIKGIRILAYDTEHVTYNYSYMPIFVEEDKYGMSRNKLYDYLAKNHIYTRKYFYPIVPEFGCYENSDFKGDTSVAHRIAEQVLTLPIYADLPIEKVDLICDLLENAG